MAKKTNSLLYQEKDYVNYFCNSLEKSGVPYTREFYIPEVGYVDVVTDKCLYELKLVTRFHHGLGQLLAYNYYLKKPELVLILFPDSKYSLNPEKIRNYSSICDSYNVRLETVDSLYDTNYLSSFN